MVLALSILELTLIKECSLSESVPKEHRLLDESACDRVTLFSKVSLLSLISCNLDIIENYFIPSKKKVYLHQIDRKFLGGRKYGKLGTSFVYLNYLPLQHTSDNDTIR